jgi:hypothetical protein
MSGSSSALLYADDGEAGANIRVSLPRLGPMKRPNPYFLFFDCAITFLVAFCFFTIGTVSRALAFGSDWIGMCAIGGATAACYMLIAVVTGGTTAPHLDILTVLLSLKMFGLKSFRKDPVDEMNISYIPGVVRSSDGQHRYSLGLIQAFWLILTLIAAGFASAGISRLVLDSAYDNAEIVIRDSDFNAGEAFFIETFGVFFMNFLALQLPLNGVHPINTAILLGIVALGFQAFGFNVSSACFNFVRWLSTNAVGGSSAWSSASWVWPVAVLVGGAGIYVVSMLMSWALYQGNRWNEKKANK